MSVDRLAAHKQLDSIVVGFDLIGRIGPPLHHNAGDGHDDENDRPDRRRLPHVFERVGGEIGQSHSFNTEQKRTDGKRSAT